LVPRGYDGAKKVKGRKRHIVNDTQGLVLGCYVGPADENDRQGIIPALEEAKSKYPSLSKARADMGYQSNKLKDYIQHKYGIELEVVKRPPSSFWIHKDTPIDQIAVREPGFKVQARRWVVERTFAWINRNRRLAKEYDMLLDSTESLIYLSLSRLMLRREYV